MRSRFALCMLLVGGLTVGSRAEALEDRLVGRMAVATAAAVSALADSALIRAGGTLDSGAGGERFGGQTRGVRRWLYGEAELPIASRAAVVLAGGVRPDRPELAQRGGRFAGLGLRFDIGPAEPAADPVPSPAPPLDVVAVGPERYRVTVLAAETRSVEITGDLTDWNVVSLRRSVAFPERWEARVDRPPGVYHVNVRRDGGARIRGTACGRDIDLVAR